MRAARTVEGAASAALQIAGTKGILQWQDFCIPIEENACEFTLKGEGAMADLDTRIEQSIELKKASPCFMYSTQLLCAILAGGSCAAKQEVAALPAAHGPIYLDGL